MKITANFFWMGNDFQFLNRLAILSHIKVGHNVVIWLSGEVPKSKYWIDDISEVKVNNADDIISVDSFYNSILRISEAKQLRITSDMWQFVFLYEYGGLYCDTDVIALKKFPNSEWIISRDSEDEEGTFALGIIKAPAKHPVFKYCMHNVKKAWGNTYVFTKAIKQYKLDLTHPKEAFHPFSCSKHSRYLRETKTSILLKSGDIPEAYSIHYFSNKTHLLNIDENTTKEYPDSVLSKLSKWVFEEYNYVNNRK